MSAARVLSAILYGNSLLVLASTGPLIFGFATVAAVVLIGLGHRRRRAVTS